MNKTITLARRNFSPTGGAENYLLRIARLLQSHGYELELLCETWPASDDYLFKTIHTTRTRSPRAFAEAARQWRREHPHSFFFSLERVYEADLYRAGDGLHAEWLRRRAFYYRFRGQVQNWIKIKNWQMLKLEKAMIRGGRIRHIIANSKMVLDSYASAGYPRECLSLIYNGVDFNFFSSGDRVRGRRFFGWRDGECVALFVGAGRERKGFRFAQEAVASVKGMRFFAVESPPAIPMPDVYAAADIFLFPTLYDPCANVTFEAWAAGLPVITTRDNGASELMTDGCEGFILKQANDVPALREKLKFLLDSDIRRTMGASAARLASRQDQMATAERVLKVIEEIKMRKWDDRDSNPEPRA